MKRVASTILAAGLLACGLAPAGPAGAQAPTKVKLTIPVTALSMTPVYLAQARGHFAEEGLEVATTTTGGSGPDIRALIAGEVDFTFTPGDNVLLAFQEGKGLVMVMSGLNRLFINWAMHRDVARERGITEGTPLPEKLKALKGLSVGVTTPGALTAHLAAFVIRKAGYVPQQDVKILPIGSGPTWLAALENRKVDVALTATPTPETAILRGYAIMFIDNAKGGSVLHRIPDGQPDHASRGHREEPRPGAPYGPRPLSGEPVGPLGLGRGGGGRAAADVRPGRPGHPPGRGEGRPARDQRDRAHDRAQLPDHARGPGPGRTAQESRRARRRPALSTRGWLLLYRALFGLGLLAFWEGASGRLIDPFWVSSPSRVFVYLAQVTLDGSIFEHAAVTLYETAVGFVLGSLSGVGMGFLLARHETLAAVLDPYIVAFNGIPRIALAPIFIIWFGIGPTSKIVLVVLVVFFLTFFSTYSGIKGVDPELKNLLRIMGASERQVLLKITVPATMPWILTGLKLSVPYALVGAVVGEFVAASKGLGYLINYNTSLFSTTGALGGILVLAAVVVLCNEVLNRAEARLLRWRPREEGRSADLY